MEAVKPFVTLAVALSSYSLIINCLFGHRTYWRSLRNIKRWLRHAQQSCRKLFIPARQLEPAILQLNLLEHDVSMYMLSFLSPYDILILMQTCRSQLQQCQRPHVWQQLLARVICKMRQRTAVDISMSFPLSPLPSHQAYFSVCKDIISHIADKHNVCCIFISGNLYDVTSFLPEHPGGASILLDYIGKDATREFKLANHSYIARDLMQGLLVVSHREVFGYKGMPSFVSRAADKRIVRWFS